MFTNRIRASIGLALLGGAVSVSYGGASKGPRCDLDWRGQGATIVKLGGEVMVSQSPFVSATRGMRVENGGRVMVLDESFAVVAYDDGCWHEMGPNSMLTIEDVSPCCAPPPVAAAAPVPEAAGVFPVWPIPAAIGAIAGGVVWANNRDDDTPPSQRPPISQ